MPDNMFENYASLIKDNTSDSNPKYDENYFKAFYLNKLPKDKNIKILDIGCGNGKYLKVLKKYGYNSIFGIDISEEQIKIAKQSNLNVQCSDALEFLKNNTKKYDVIFLIDVLEHIELEKTFELIDLIYNSLENEGSFFIQVPNAIAPLSPLRYADITHKRAYTTYSLRQTLKFSGFKYLKFYELAPFVHGTKSFVRNALWHLMIKPIIKSFMLTSYGTSFEKIYTANFLCILKK